MPSPNWTPYCPQTGMHHGNALSCGSCLATHSPSPPRTTARPTEVIQIDSPSPPRATTVFAKPKFTNYNRTHGAEQLRQATIMRTKKESLDPAFAYNANVVFFLLTQVKDEDGFFTPMNCKPIGMLSILVLYINIIINI
jgi:hypothetical protein